MELLDPEYKNAIVVIINPWQPRGSPQCWAGILPKRVQCYTVYHAQEQKEQRNTGKALYHVIFSENAVWKAGLLLTSTTAVSESRCNMESIIPRRF